MAALERSTPVQKLGIDTIGDDSALALVLQVLSTSELGESPLATDNDLLTARELELGTAESLLSMLSIVVLAPDREQDLTNSHPGTCPQGLSKSTPHASLEPISSCTRKHLVDSEHMEGVDTDTQVEGILASELGHVLVACNASSLKGFAGDVFLLPRGKVDTEREIISGLPLHANIIDTDLWVGHTTAVARLRVRLVLDLTIASRWS